MVVLLLAIAQDEAHLVLGQWQTNLRLRTQNVRRARRRMVAGAIERIFGHGRREKDGARMLASQRAR